MKTSALSEPKPFKAFRDKYLAAVMMVAALLICSLASAQTTDSLKYSQINGYGFKYKRMAFDSTLMIPLSTSPHAPYRMGALRYRASDSTLQLWTGYQWNSILTGVGNGVDTAYAYDDSTIAIETPDQDYFITLHSRYYTNAPGAGDTLLTASNTIKRIDRDNYGIVISTNANKLLFSIDTTQTNHLVTTSDLNDAIAASPGGITELTGDVVAGPGSGSQSATIATNAVTDSKLAQVPGLSVKGNIGNTTDDVGNITAGNDGNILRRFGTSIGFGTINLASTNAVGSSILPVLNGGTGTSFPALVAGTNISITGTWPNQTINATGGGESNTASNVGATGVGVFKQKTGVDLEFKKLKSDYGLTITGNTSDVDLSADTSSTNGMVTKYMLDSLKGAYSLTKTNTSLVTPSALTFTSVNATRMFDLMPEKFKLFELNPKQTFGNNAAYVIAFSDISATSTITNQKFTLTANGTGAYNGTLFYSSPKMSWWTFKAGLDNASGTGSLQGGLIKDANNYFGYSYEQTNNRIRYIVNVAGTPTSSQYYTLANNTPFEISVSCTGTALKLYITYSDNSVQDIPMWDVLDSAGIDMRVKSIYNGSYKFGVYNYSPSSITTYQFNYLKGGHFGATGIADFTIVNTDQGQPYTRDNKFFFASSFRGYNLTGDLGGFTRNNGFGVISVDMNTYQIDYESVLTSTYEDDTLMMAGANCYVYDTKANKFLCLLASFGGINAGLHFIPGMLRWQLTDDDILSGAHVLDSLQQFLPDSTGWDPSAVKINGEWYIGYATYHPPYDKSWITIVKTTNFSTFTTVAADSSQTDNWEGVKVAKIGGQLYFMISGHTNVRLYNATTGAYSQSISQSIVITDYPSNHACIFPVEQKGRTKYWWLSFTKDNFGSNEYTYGDAVLFISDQSEAGYEFPIRNYLR